MARLRFRIDLDGGAALGPGKVRLLELVRSSGSISAAARAMGMSYRRAWLLLDELNRSFASPVVTAAVGGPRGGGAALTPFGEELVERFREMESKAEAAVAADLERLDRAARPTAERRARSVRRSIGGRERG